MNSSWMPITCTIWSRGANTRTPTNYHYVSDMNGYSYQPVRQHSLPERSELSERRQHVHLQLRRRVHGYTVPDK